MQAAAKAASEGCGADSGEIQLALVAAELQEALSNFKGADASASPNAAHFPLAQALGKHARTRPVICYRMTIIPSYSTDPFLIFDNFSR